VRHLTGFALVLSSLGTGILLHSSFPHFFSWKGSTGSPLGEIRQGSQGFTNPLLECSNSPAKEFSSLREKLIAAEQSAEKEGLAKRVAIYFRDLNNGPWIGVDEDLRFSPASLLKVPLLMAYLKQAERVPDLLSRKIVYRREEADIKGVSANILPERRLKNGETYKLETVLDRMISESDNDALAVLATPEFLSIEKKIIDDLGITTERSADDVTITVKEYASIFRVLFNASYLSRSTSEKALSMLTRTRYQKGLAGSIPRNIPIAHKFGERQFGNQFQLHDCGIIYYPRAPYLLCLMTQGDNLDNLSKVIGELSRIVFHEVSSQLQTSQAGPMTNLINSR
jgi:beta-lactamase class A